MTPEMEKHIRAMGLDPADHVLHHVATVGDLKVSSSKHLTVVKCDDEVVLSMMRKDGGLQELIDALQSQVVK